MITPRRPNAMHHYQAQFLLLSLLVYVFPSRVYYVRFRCPTSSTFSFIRHKGLFYIISSHSFRLTSFLYAYAMHTISASKRTT
jgi:hypothetical protein